MTFLDNPEILEESQTLEFKESLFELPDDLWETYSAFANTEGGEIVLGVKQNRENETFSLVGVQDQNDLIAKFWNKVRNREYVSRDVMLYDGVSPVTVNGFKLIIIRVPKASREEKPVRVRTKKSKELKPFIRRGEGDYPATDEDLRLMQYDSVPSADRKALSEFDETSLCEKTIRRYRALFNSARPQSPWVSDSDTDFLYHIGALSKDAYGSLRPTQAGLFAFGHEYEITRYSPSFLLDYREETAESQRWSDRIVSNSADWSGNIIDFYLDVRGRLSRYFKASFSTDETGMSRNVTSEVGEAANEVLVNALVHSWYGGTATVRVILKAESLETSNPGSMLVAPSIAINGGFSEPRNPTLMKIFNLIGAGDRAGSGLCAVWKICIDHFSLTPTMEEKHHPDGLFFSMPIADARNNHLTVEPNRGDIEHRMIEDNEILAIFDRYPAGLTPKDFVNTLPREFRISDRRAQERLKELVDAGALNRKKSGRSYIYLSR